MQRGQCTIPASANSGVTAIAGGYGHTIALKGGAVLAWGRNYEGQCDIPASANSGISAIAGGEMHTIALKDGAVLAWGYNVNGQCTIPASANSGVSAIAGGYGHTIALKGGAVLAWGYNGNGQCTIPASANSGVSAIAGGAYHTIALYPFKDCNNNGTDDFIDIADHIPGMPPKDFNNNGILDTCDIASHPSLDHNLNGLLDSWDISQNATLDRNNNGVLDSWDVVVDPALDCNSNGHIDQYDIADNPSWDCNLNGRLDSCDIALHNEEDCNLNAIPDSCDLLSGVLVDANRNGIPDSCELAGPFGLVRAWGDAQPNPDGSFSLTPPSNLGLCSQVAAAGSAQNMNSFQCLALQANGIVVSWGTGSVLVIPSDLGQCKAIAVGSAYNSAMAIRKDGTVWSTNPVPVDLTTCTKISMSMSHSVALQTNSLVRAWGSTNSSGELNVPANLGKCIDIGAGGGLYAYQPFTVALKENGTFQGWGDNSKGQCTAPSNLGPCIQIAASKSYYDHFCAAIQSAGTVAVWGYSGSGQTTIPPDLGTCSSIVISEYTILALQTNGMVRTWGGFNVPPDLGAATAIAHGSNFALAIQMDCDTNGAPDSVQTVANPLLDLNHNYQLDSCEIQQGYEEDCNKNQMIDSAEPNYYAPVTLNSGHLSPIGYGNNQTWNIQTPALAISDPVLHLSMKGDLSLTMEYVTVYMNQRFMGVYFKYPSSDCLAVNQEIPIPLEIFNSLIQSGAVGTSDLAIEIIPSVAVDPNLCLNGTWVEATLSYTSALTKDCNANGLLDSCEVALIPSLDTNNNGTLDECDGQGFQAPCIGDLDQNRFVDSSDVGIVLLNIGYLTMPGDPMDFDANGIIDNGDIGFVLLNTGECP